MLSMGVMPVWIRALSGSVALLALAGCSPEPSASTTPPDGRTSAPPTAPEPEPPPSTAPDPEPIPENDRLVLRVGSGNNAWTIVVYPDGRFTTEETWSDAEWSFRNDCGGHTPTGDVELWFARARDSATLESHPPSSHRAPNGYSYSLTNHRVDGTVRYVPTDVHAEALAKWAGTMMLC